MKTNLEKIVVIFDPVNHTYKDNIGRFYTSVTTYLSEFQEKFDTVGVAKAYAKKYGKTPDYWIKEWDKIRIKALEDGTKIHDDLENSFSDDGSKMIAKDKRIINRINFKNFVDSENVKKLFPIVNDDINSIIAEGYKPVVEQTVFDVESLISGRVDIFFVDEKNRTFKVRDYKTDKYTILKESGFFKKINGEITDIFVRTNRSFKYPLNMLPDCNYYKYCMQLSLYAKFIEKNFDLKLEDIKLYHLKKIMKGGKFVEFKDEVIDIDYLENEVSILLQHRMENLCTN